VQTPSYKLDVELDLNSTFNSDNSPEKNMAIFSFIMNIIVGDYFVISLLPNKEISKSS